MLNIDLEGKWAFIAGVGDDRGFGWAIAKALAEAGCNLLIGTWAPVAEIFSKAFDLGKFDQSRLLRSGKLMNFEEIYPLDANFDAKEDVPSEIADNKRYRNLEGYTLTEVAAKAAQKAGKIDILVHSLANATEIKEPLMKTSRSGYLAALGASTYSLIGLLKAFTPHMPKGASALTLTYCASQRVIPGYGGGMSSAKAALESDIRTLAWELGRSHEIRLNAISAGPLKSRAASAIGFIEPMIAYSEANAPLTRPLNAQQVADAAAFLLSSLSSAITGAVVPVDNGLHAMGVAVDSRSIDCKKS